MRTANVLLMIAVLVVAPSGGARSSDPPKTKLTDRGGIEFRMENKPWSEVFEWLSKQSGVPVITSFKVAGSFTFIGPEGAKYTLPEIEFIINRALLHQNELALIRRERCFAIMAADSLIFDQTDGK
jgi:hypothetical protein